MIQYIPFKEVRFSPYIGYYHSFGIAAIRFTDLELDWQKEEVISDVSTDLSFVIQLSQRCTRGELSPIHLLDVVLDSI